MQTLAKARERDTQDANASEADAVPMDRFGPDRADSFHRWMNRRWPADPLGTPHTGRPTGR